MKAFCKLTLPGLTKFGGTPHQSGHTLYSFYVFSAALDYYGEGLYGGRNYGEEFAAYIRANNLGKVIETDNVPNVAFHPDHCNKLWIWTPDETALYKWRADNVQLTPKKPAAIKFQPVPVSSVECSVCAAVFDKDENGDYCPSCDYYNGPDRPDEPDYYDDGDNGDEDDL
jgi:hypothetical protein